MLKELLDEKLKEVKSEKHDSLSEIAESYPGFYLNAKTLPEIRDWEVGEDYYIVVKATMRSKEKYENEDKKSCSGSFDIKEIGVVEDEDDYEEDYEDEDLTKAELMKKYGR